MLIKMILLPGEVAAHAHAFLIVALFIPFQSMSPVIGSWILSGPKTFGSSSKQDSRLKSDGSASESDSLVDGAACTGRGGDGSCPRDASEAQPPQSAQSAIGIESDETVSVVPFHLRMSLASRLWCAARRPSHAKVSSTPSHLDRLRVGHACGTKAGMTNSSNSARTSARERTPVTQVMIADSQSMSPFRKWLNTARRRSFDNNPASSILMRVCVCAFAGKKMS